MLMRSTNSLLWQQAHQVRRSDWPDDCVSRYLTAGRRLHCKHGLTTTVIVEPTLREVSGMGGGSACITGPTMRSATVPVSVAGRLCPCRRRCFSSTRSQGDRDRLHLTYQCIGLANWSRPFIADHTCPSKNECGCLLSRSRRWRFRMRLGALA